MIHSAMLKNPFHKNVRRKRLNGPNLNKINNNTQAIRINQEPVLTSGHSKELMLKGLMASI